MNAIDLAFGFVAGFLSCLSPASLMLLPLLLVAVGARDRPLTLAIGLGISLIATGALAAAVNRYFGLDATVVRRAVCAVLIAVGLILNSRALTARFAAFTGGTGEFDSGEPTRVGIVMRQFLLVLFVGANWLPPLGPTLGKASLMAADSRDFGLALGTLFAFGLGAAMPWIVLGRFLRMVPGIGSGSLARGMTGKRVLGLVLIFVAGCGLTGLDIAVSRDLEPFLPAWTGKLAPMF